jgi:hypothetical protein
MVFGGGRIAITSTAFPGLLRTYSGYSAALADIVDARTFAGFHFRFASVDGVKMGRKIARQDSQALARPLKHRHHR